MLIWSTSLLVQESQGVTAPFRGHEPELARSAQMVNHEKDLVPREVGALAHDVFEVARACMDHHVDHLIFRGRMLCHAPPVGEQNALLQEQSCIVGATG
jgi:hypothetical protein